MTTRSVRPVNKSRLQIPIIAAIAILLIVIAGEALIVTSGHSDYGTTLSEDGRSCEIDCRGTHCYDIVVTEGSFDTPSEVYIYYDEAYGSAHETSAVAVGARELTEKSYAEQLVKTLKIRNVGNISIIDAHGLAELVCKNGSGIALVSVSGAIPDTVYDGTSNSGIIKWIESGGRLYWAGNVLGKYISHSDGSTTAVDNGTSLFLGSECIDSEKTQSYTRIDNGFGIAYSLISNDARYSVDTSKLLDGSSYLAFGYTDGKRSSSCAVSVGGGMICVIGGDYSDYQRIDMAQIIASGLSPQTKIIHHQTGSVSGKKTIGISAGEHVYIYIGGDLSIYAQLHRVI